MLIHQCTAPLIHEDYAVSRQVIAVCGLVLAKQCACGGIRLRHRVDTAEFFVDHSKDVLMEVSKRVAVARIIAH